MGLIVLIAFAIYVLLSIGLAVGAHYLGKRKGWKWCRWWTVGLVMLLIPAWDIPIGMVYFKNLCGSQAGMHVYETVKLDDKYLYKPGEINKSRLDKNGDYAVARDGEINREALAQRYDFSFSKLSVYSDLFHISKRERVIKDMERDKILGKSVSFIYSGGWLLVSLGGANYYCGDEYKPISDKYIHSELFRRIFSKPEY